MRDLELWGLLKRGDQAAFQQIYQQYIRLLYQYGYQFCQHPALVEDAIQDLFLRIWERRKNLGDTDNPKFYLMLSLKREVLSKLKSGKYESTAVTEEGLKDFNPQFSVEEEIILQEHQNINASKIKKALGSLSKRQREVIYHRFFLGLSYEETAEIMALNYQSVRNLQSNALKQMKSDIGDIGVVLLLLQQCIKI